MQTDTPTNTFKALLKSSGLKLTKNRQVIFDTLLRADKPLTIQEIVHLSHEHHFVSIYRAIDTLLKANIVKAVPYGFKAKYELSDNLKPHHHHATCEVCGTTQEIGNKQAEKLMKLMTLEAGLLPTKHHFELFGICRSCREDSKQF